MMLCADQSGVGLWQRNQDQPFFVDPTSQAAKHAAPLGARSSSDTKRARSGCCQLTRRSTFV